MKTFLIVDDMTVIRATIKTIITQLGVPCECLEAGDGVEALRYFAHYKIDLVFLDWRMPEGSGLEFLRRARALQLDVPVIMVTGESDRSKVLEAMRAGAADYIVKPVTMEVIKEKLEKLNMLEEAE
ncbi:MAG: response regulator [Treponema sp.]|jgi:two-component system chemotaxis response regulator CheY|nr:response regulator [Treponema sp.]